MQKKFITLTLLALSPGAFAAQVPSAGSELRQIPPAPAPERETPQLPAAPNNAPAAKPADETTILVNSLHVRDAHAFPEAELIAATGFKPGSEFTLSALRGFAAQIANYYRSHGYFLAQAHLPAQDIVDGAVSIAVVEGQYGKVVLRNQSKLADAVANTLLEGLNSGDTIKLVPLESRLLQLSDLPGVSIKSTLVPGASVGASDLIVDVTPGRRLSGSIDADNSGSRYTGTHRTGGTLNINNPAGHGDVATLRALTSWDGLNYARLSYQMQVGRGDIGAAYTALDYKLGNEFESLQAHGTAQIASLYGRYPLLRSRNNSLYAQLNFDTKTFHDRLALTTPATVADKKANVAMLSLLGDYRDAFAGGGISNFSLTWSSGGLDLRSPAATSVDAATARSDGHYDKFGFSFARLQRVTQSISLYAAARAQLATKNLDVSEKMELGGANGVRSYPEGEAYSDQGYVLNLEARLPLWNSAQRLPGQMQLVTFVDTGTGSLNKNPWDAGRNQHTLSGAGLGLNWFEAHGLTMKAYYAHKLGSAEATSVPDTDGRFWINAVKYF